MSYVLLYIIMYITFKLFIFIHTTSLFKNPSIS